MFYQDLLFFHHQDFSFILRGLTQLLNNPLVQTYLPRSTKKIHFHQELLILFWKFCDFNKVLLNRCLHADEPLVCFRIERTNFKCTSGLQTDFEVLFPCVFGLSFSPDDVLVLMRYHPP